MRDEYRSIIKRMSKLNIMHRILIHKTAIQNEIFFGQFPILEYIIINENCTQKDIADFLSVSAPSIATSIKRMQRAGLLVKVTDNNDLRCNRINITKKGYDVYENSKEKFHQIDARLFQNFTDKECEDFYNYLGRMLENISTDEFEGKSTMSLIAEEKMMRDKMIREEIKAKEREEKEND